MIALVSFALLMTQAAPAPFPVAPPAGLAAQAVVPSAPAPASGPSLLGALLHPAAAHAPSAPTPTRFPLQTLTQTGPAKGNSGAVLGISLIGGDGSVRIESVASGSAAERAGLEAGDLILTLDGRGIADANQVVAAVTSRRPGESLVMDIRRGDRNMTLLVRLGGSGAGNPPAASGPSIRSSPSGVPAPSSGPVAKPRTNSGLPQAAREEEEVLLDRNAAPDDGGTVRRPLALRRDPSGGPGSQTDLELEMERRAQAHANNADATRKAMEQARKQLEIARTQIQDATQARPFLGVTLGENGDGEVTIESVVSGSGAEAAGLLAGDRVLKANGVLVDSADALREQIGSKRIGQRLSLEVQRNGEPVRLKARLGRNDAEASESVEELEIEDGEGEGEGEGQEMSWSEFSFGTDGESEAQAKARMKFFGDAARGGQSQSEEREESETRGSRMLRGFEVYRGSEGPFDFEWSEGFGEDLEQQVEAWQEQMEAEMERFSVELEQHLEVWQQQFDGWMEDFSSQLERQLDSTRGRGQRLKLPSSPKLQLRDLVPTPPRAPRPPRGLGLQGGQAPQIHWQGSPGDSMRSEVRVGPDGQVERHVYIGRPGQNGELRWEEVEPEDGQPSEGVRLFRSQGREVENSKQDSERQALERESAALRQRIAELEAKLKDLERQGLK